MNRPFTRLLLAVAFGFALTVTLQWSWNTIAPIFGGPALQLRHTLAGVVLLFALTSLLRPRSHHSRRLKGERL